MSEEKPRARDGGPLIIGTGLPRTGTTSLCEALETLGFAPCHHFRSMLTDDAFPYPDCRLWSKAARTEDKDARQDMLHYLLTKTNYKAAVDYPTSCFISDMVEMYPNAKFIHGERSSPEVWRNSFNQTVGRIHLDRVFYYATYLLPVMRLAIGPVTSAMDERNKTAFNASIYSLDSQIEVYHRHNAFVRQVVPKGNMLEYDPKKGYEPLCEFLNVPIPSDERGNKVDFPHANDSGKSQRGFQFLTAFGLAVWGVVVSGAYFVIRRAVVSVT